jgi:hypothetical protein
MRNWKQLNAKSGTNCLKSDAFQPLFRVLYQEWIGILKARSGIGGTDLSDWNFTL